MASGAQYVKAISKIQIGPLRCNNAVLFLMASFQEAQMAGNRRTPNQSFNPDATSASHFPHQASRFLVSPQRAASVAPVMIPHQR